MTQHYRADLHIHSCFSDRQSVWALRKMNCPESYTTPEFIYRTAKKKGMDYVTITDHNSINGALKIAHLPDAFVSVEVDTFFPENNCKIHVVVLDISEAVFKEIMCLQKNVYELVAYLRKGGIAHFVAHPFGSLNGRLNAETIEKMLLLFGVFESVNGTRAGQLSTFMNKVVSSLTQERFEVIANRHNIPLWGDTPWKKAFVGGSDDHSGLFIARAYTVSAQGKTLPGFVSAIREHKTWAEGEEGNPLSLAHNIYRIGYQYYTAQTKQRNNSSMPFINLLLKKAFKPGQKISLFEKLKLLIKKSIPDMSRNHEGKTFEKILDDEARKLISDPKLISSLKTADNSRSTFNLISYLMNRMIYIYFDRMVNIPFGANIFQVLKSFGMLVVIHLIAAPYGITFNHPHRSKGLVGQLRKSLGIPDDTKEKVALFTDTFDEINGVSVTIKKLIKTAEHRGIDLTVITCNKKETSFSNKTKSFKSIGDFSPSDYPDLTLYIPPTLDVLDYFDQEGFTRIHVSTPGTVGLLALFIARLMDIPISATYHTNIPQCVMSFSGDAVVEKVAWHYVVWFYNQMDEVLVPSKSTQDQIIEKGISPEKIKPLLRWVDVDAFSPKKRNPHVWEKYNLNGAIKFLYVGRVSKEKNLDLLAQAFIDTIKAGFFSYLIIVGDGPIKIELEGKLKGYPVVFTGYLTGEELSTLYASSDVFVFPSTFDTFGNVVLEAQASGLPVIVSDKGGPQELMIPNETGYVIKANDKAALVGVLTFLITNVETMKTMGEKARQFIETKAMRPEDMYSAIFQV